MIVGDKETLRHSNTLESMGMQPILTDSIEKIGLCSISKISNKKIRMKK